jgi:hypothetical protein
MKTLSYHQQSKNGVKTCQIVRVETQQNPDAEQLSMFSKETWEDEMIKTIRRFKSFYPSEIRLMCSTLPPYDNDSGPFYKTLMSKGKITRTGKYRKSLCSSRRGGFEWEYENQGV